MGGPLVSVVICFLNAERFLGEAVESVLGQTLDDWELLLVDDGSTDASASIASRYASRNPRRIRLLSHPGRENRGIAASRNLGFREARGRYVALLDADDVYENSRLERHATLLERDRELGAVLSHELYWRSWSSDSALERRYLDQVMGPAVVSGRRYEPPGLIVATLLTRGAPMPSTCSLTARTDAVRRIGGIPEEFRVHYEDQVLFCKLLLDYPVWVHGEPLARYRQNPDSVTQGNSPLEDQPGSRAMEARKQFLVWLDGYLQESDLALPELNDWICAELESMEKAATSPGVATGARVRNHVFALPSRWLPPALLTPVRRARQRLHAARVRHAVMGRIAALERLSRP